jgi:hypothetical protein
MWEKVSIRLHAPRKIFPFGIQADAFMLYKNVDYTFKDKQKGTVYFLVVEDDGIKVDCEIVRMGCKSKVN